MTLIKNTSAAALIVACALASLNAHALDDCVQINKIIDSGLDRQNPFSAVAGLTLPEADLCTVKYGSQNSERNLFMCHWNAENHLLLEKMEDELDELFDFYVHHDGGDDAWEEAEEFIKKSNYWARTYNAGIRSIPRPNYAQRMELNKWRSRAKRFERRAHAAEKEAMALDREKEEAEAKYKAKEAEVKTFRKDNKRLVEQQTGGLYTGMYECFSSGTIRNSSAYKVDSRATSWTSQGGCSIYIESYEGPKLSISCPNPR